MVKNQLPTQQLLAFRSLKQGGVSSAPNAVFFNYFSSITKDSPSEKLMGNKHLGACENPAGFLSTSAEAFKPDL